jgi:hypothetical protein
MPKRNKILRIAGLFAIITILLTAVMFFSIPRNNHKLIINYQEPDNLQDIATLNLLKNEGINELIVDVINDLFIIPEPLSLNYGEKEGPEYDAETYRILIPYSFIPEVEERFSDAKYADAGISIKDATMDALMHTILHETAHALIDLYDLPIVVKEEDAADALATLLLIEFFEEGQEIAITAADLFDLESDDIKDFEEADFWDEHSLDVQRYYNTLCTVYGSAPKEYAEIAKDAEFSDEKAEQCIDDYQQLYFSWMTLLKPFLKKKQLREFR